MAAVWRDVRYALRLFARERAFTAMAVVTLALGLGSSTAVYSVVDAVLLRPLPYVPSDRVVQIVQDFGRRGTIGGSFTTLTSAIVIREVFEAWRDGTTTLDGLGKFGMRSITLGGQPESLRLRASNLSPQVFTILSTSPLAGRLFSAEENQPGQDAVVVLGEKLWRSRFGADPNIAGRTCTLDDRTFTIVGVVPASFTFPDPEAAMWLPFVETPPPPVQPGTRFIDAFTAVARLKPGVTVAQAEAEGTLVARRVQAVLGDFGSKDDGPAVIRLYPMQERVVGRVRPALLIVLGAVAFVLLISAANLAHVLLARGTARQREMAVRAAIGASRRRLIQQSLTESVLLSLAAGALGIFFARWLLALLPVLAPATIPRLHEVGLDGHVLGGALILSLLTAVLFGMLPALQAARADTGRGMAEGTSQELGGLRARHNRARTVVIVAELAVTLVLMVGASLLIESFVRLLRVEPGYESANVATAQITLPASRYPAGRRAAFYEELLARSAGLPSVEAAGLAVSLPLTPGRSNAGVRFENAGPSTPPAAPMSADLRIVSPGYFKVLGPQLRAGRVLTDADTPDTAHVALVNEAFVRTYLGGASPLGRSIRVAGVDGVQIVGVVGDVHHAALTAAPVPEIYRSFRQSPRGGGSMTLVLRSSRDAVALLAPVRALVTEMDPALPVDSAMTMDQRRSNSVAEARFYTILLGGFAGLALVIAIVGTYGVIAYNVAQRRREIGVRVALGARTTDVMRLVLGQSVALVGAALVLGVAAALAVTQVLQRFLYEVQPTDASSFASAALVLGLAALAASYVPARRAARLDPVDAMRQQ
jgi:putative ABC transport system permease protein